MKDRIIISLMWGIPFILIGLWVSEQPEPTGVGQVFGLVSICLGIIGIVYGLTCPWSRLE